MKKVSNALSVFALALVLSMGTFASVASAQEWGDSYSFDGGGSSWGDSYSYDGGSSWGDSYSYDGGSGWGDSYSYDGGNAWGDSYSTDGGYGDLYSYDGGNLYSQDGGNLYSYDGGGNLYSYDGGGNLYTNDGGNLYTYDGGNLYTADGGNLYTADENGYYVDEYMDEYAQEYVQQQMGGSSYGGGSYGGGSYGGGSMGGYSIPGFSSTGGCTSCHTQSYPNPGCTRNCYPTPTPTPTPRPNPTCTTCGGSNITNVNTNTNTYVDNSINDSFNTNISNSGNTTILAPVVPQQQVVYQQQYAAPYCVISLTGAGQYNAQATLVWSSSNANSAYISQIGAVAPNGQRYVTGYANQTYSLTVTGQGGTYTCQTQMYTPTYVPPTITPSVSLTQIPYTGLALSPMAQAMYWLSLLSVAAAGGYLLVYYKGGALALAGASMARRQNHFVVSEQDATEVETPVIDEVEEVATTPVVSTFSLPTIAETYTRDAMHMIRNASGVPQIVISRA